MSTIAIQLDQVSKRYLIYNSPGDRLKQSLFRHKNYYRELQALSTLDLTIERGETVGIVGRNGSGKSTLLQIICGTLTPTHGSVKVHGRVSALLELGAGFNPEFTGKENIYLNGAILGLTEKQIKERYVSIVEFSGLEPHLLLQPVKTYSSGMYVRLAFAIAISVDPDILVIDEAMAVGDEAFQRKCFARIRAMQQDGVTVLFVSHSSGTIIDLCDRAILLEHGELVSSGMPKTVIADYHKLIYAPIEKQPEILAQIRSNTHTHEHVISLASEDVDASDDEGFNPEMKPESTVIYASHGAEIMQPRIVDAKGQQVNMLSRGKEYTFQYRVVFSEAAQHVRFGMIIKTKSGMELGGGSVKGDVNVQAGTTLEVSFRFTARLSAGVYFLNCGCSGEVGGNDTFLHRITDALMFRVLPGDATAQTGIIDFGVTPLVKALNHA